jgi:ANTAR domain
VAAELVAAGVELANRELEVAQLRQALTNRVWIEQAKGVLVATQGTDPEVAFQQLRATARATSRKLAGVAQEVVQDAQRQRLAALAAQADLAQREHAADERERAADDRDRIADERDHVAEERDRTADHRD